MEVWSTLSLQQGNKRLLTYPRHTPFQTFQHRSWSHTNQLWCTFPLFLFHPLSSMPRDWPHQGRLWHSYLEFLSLQSMWLREAITIWLSPCQLPHFGLRQEDEWYDSVIQQEVTTGVEDHLDPKNPDHSTSQVSCRVMLSYGQVWDPWRVEGGIVTISFPTCFTCRFVLLCCTLTCWTDTCVICCFILYFSHHFIYLYVWAYSIYSVCRTV